MNIINWVVGKLSGKKTYFLALVALVYAISGYFLGNIEGKTAMELIWAALSSMTLRAGIAKS